MKTILTITCLLLACQGVRAGNSNANPTAAQSAPVVDTKPGAAKATAASTKAYTPSHKSVFIASTNDHNPFWPIGWVNIESLSASDTEAPMVPRVDDFSVSSILLNEPPLAVVNGKEMAEGEIAPVSINGQTVTVQLMAVQDGRVILRWQNQNLVVPLHRQEELSRADSDPSTTLR